MQEHRKSLDNIDLYGEWTLFLDRDGVINRRLPGDYVKNSEEFSFLNSVPEALAILAKLFKYILIVSNQRGIGRGLMTKEDLDLVHKCMLAKISEAGGRIDAVYFCPDTEDSADGCRKPAPGMALQARLDFPDIDFQKSLMVGDSYSDILFGKKLGMLTCLLTGDPGAAKEIEIADLTFPFLIDLADAVQMKQ